jgi:hypothetical protein
MIVKVGIFLMEGVCRNPPNAARHHGEEKDEEYS